MKVRGIRGAISVEENSKEKIFEATKTLLLKMVQENQVEVDDICSIFFSSTKDLNACFPATAARELGWNYVPMFSLNEVDVKNSPEKILRVLMHVNTTKSMKEIKHIYLKDAKKLRPDLVNRGKSDED